MNKISMDMNEYRELEKLFDELDEICNDEELWSFQNHFATFFITIGQEFETIKDELNFGNVNITNDMLTHINEQGEINTYKIVQRKAKKNDIVHIIKAESQTPFNSKHIGRFYIVSEEADKESLKWVQDHVVVGRNCLYDDQYVVLEPLST